MDKLEYSVKIGSLQEGDIYGMNKKLLPLASIALLLSMVGCSEVDETPSPLPSPSSTASPELQDLEINEDGSEDSTAQGAASAYESFLNTLAVTSYEDLQAILDPYIADGVLEGEDEVNILYNLAANYPNSFGRIYTDNNIELASPVFLSFVVYVDNLEKNEIELLYSVPESAVSLDSNGTLATIDNSKLEIAHSTAKGVDVNEEPAIMVYVDGRWLFLAPSFYEEVGL